MLDGKKIFEADSISPIKMKENIHEKKKKYIKNQYFSHFL